MEGGTLRVRKPNNREREAERERERERERNGEEKEASRDQRGTRIHE
jgi:hypothetical protein